MELIIVLLIVAIILLIVIIVLLLRIYRKVDAGGQRGGVIQVTNNTY